jgi:hypothetical protein
MLLAGVGLKLEPVILMEDPVGPLGGLTEMIVGGLWAWATAKPSATASSNAARRRPFKPQENTARKNRNQLTTDLTASQSRKPKRWPTKHTKHTEARPERTFLFCVFSVFRGPVCP